MNFQKMINDFRIPWIRKKQIVFFGVVSMWEDTFAKHH